MLDADTGQPLVGANLVLLETNYGAITDSSGNYVITEVPVGRYQMQVSYLGYEGQLFPEVLLESGKEFVQNVKLTESATALQTIEVAATRSDYRVLHPLSVKTLTIEETFRFPATF